jgi:hypothetical protein
MDNLASKENPSLDALEHRAMKKERQAGEARKKWVKLTYGDADLSTLGTKIRSQDHFLPPPSRIGSFNSPLESQFDRSIGPFRNSQFREFASHGSRLFLSKSTIPEITKWLRLLLCQHLICVTTG